MPVPVTPIIEVLSTEVAEISRSVSCTRFVTYLGVSGPVTGIGKALVTEVTIIGFV